MSQLTNIENASLFHVEHVENFRQMIDNRLIAFGDKFLFKLEIMEVVCQLLYHWFVLGGARLVGEHQREIEDELVATILAVFDYHGVTQNLPIEGSPMEGKVRDSNRTNANNRLHCRIIH